MTPVKYSGNRDRTFFCCFFVILYLTRNTNTEYNLYTSVLNDIRAFAIDTCITIGKTCFNKEAL